MLDDDDDEEGRRRGRLIIITIKNNILMDGGGAAAEQLRWMEMGLSVEKIKFSDRVTSALCCDFVYKVVQRGCL